MALTVYLVDVSYLYVILELPDVALPVRLCITVGDDPGDRLGTFGQVAELLGL